jgi:L-ascorbate metabolism protein UlaG (beta-lactamase superfamily)
MKLQLIRSATMRITLNGHTFLTDPYLADKFSRPTYSGKSKNPTADLPFPADEVLKGIEMVLISHTHSDHFDPAAQEKLPKEWLLLCQPEDELKIKDKGFKQVIPVHTYVWQGITFSRTSGKHGSGTVLNDMGPVSGFVMTAPGEPLVYWAGDTILCDEVRDVVLSVKPDIIITHSCGAVWGDQVKILMDDIQTAELCKMAPNSKVIAIHMDSVDHATVTRIGLRDYAGKNGISEEQLLIPVDGEELELLRVLY